MRKEKEVEAHRHTLYGQGGESAENEMELAGFKFRLAVCGIALNNGV